MGAHLNQVFLISSSRAIGQLSAVTRQIMGETGRRNSNGTAGITLEYLQGIVSKSDPGVTVNSFQVSTGSGRGDNYTSMLFRVKMIGTTQDKSPWKRSVVCKHLPDCRARREAFKSEALFTNEVAFYTRAYPALKAFQNSRKVQIFEAVPKVYLARGNVVVLEDLKELGFVMADRKEGLDYEHCLAVLESLAKFHALSLAMKYKQPEIFELEVINTISESLFQPDNEDWYREYYKSAIKNVVNIVKEGLSTSASNDVNYLERFTSFADDAFFRRMVELVTPKEPISVLCHGDCWTNNILFKYSDSGKIVDLCLVDFQLARYASPALDVVNLMYCCTTRSLRTRHMTDLLYRYHGKLSDTLSLLGCTKEPFPQGPLSEIIMEEIRRCAKFGLGLALDIIPISTCESDQAPDLYKSAMDDSVGEHVSPVTTTSDLCRRRMLDLVQELVDQRVL